MSGLIILGVIIYFIVRHNKKKEKSKTASKDELNTVEQEVLEKMMHSLLPKVIIDELKKSEEMEWAIKGHYGEDGKREVKVYWNGIVIQLPGAYEKKDESHCFALKFEECGLNTIAAHKNKSGAEDISADRMRYLYATAIKHCFKTAFSNCKFGPVEDVRDRNLLDLYGEHDLFDSAFILMHDAVPTRFFYWVPVPETTELF